MATKTSKQKIFNINLLWIIGVIVIISVFAWGFLRLYPKTIILPSNEIEPTYRVSESASPTSSPVIEIPTGTPSTKVSNFEAEATLKRVLNLNATIPTGWKYQEDTNSVTIEKGGIQIEFSSEFGRGDTCGFDADATPSATCYSKDFLTTKDFSYTEYVVHGRTIEIVGFINDQNLKTTILVSAGTWGNQEKLDDKERAEVIAILNTVQKAE